MSDYLSPPTLDLLCAELKEIVEWDIVAVYLKVPHVDIESIRNEFHNKISRCKMQTLQKWLDQGNLKHSWAEIANAVEQVNTAVAVRIRNKYSDILDLETDQTHSNDGYPGTGQVKLAVDENIDSRQSKIKLDKDVVEEIQELKDSFDWLVITTRKEFEKKPDELSFFHQYLKQKMLEFVQLPDENVSYAKLFDALRSCWNYINYKLLARIRKRFLFDQGPDHEMIKYEEDLMKFKGSTKMKALICEVTAQKTKFGMKTVELKVGQMWAEVSLEQFEYLVKLLFHECSDFLQDVKVTGGCILISWLIPEWNVNNLVRNVQLSIHTMKALGVISLLVSDKVVFSSEEYQDDMTLDMALVSAVDSGGPLPAIVILLAAGGNPNLLTCSGETIISAVSNMKENDNTTALHIICYLSSSYASDSLVDSFLKAGANVNTTNCKGYTPLMYASKYGALKKVNVLLETNNTMLNSQNENGETSLYLASANGYSSIVALLLFHGANPNLGTDSGMTPLTIASQMGYYFIVKLLMACEIKSEPNFLDENNEDRDAALFFASENGHASVVSFLLDNDANPNADMSGQTPLMVACAKGYSQIIEILLKHNALTEIQNEYGETALSEAIKNGSCDNVSILLRNGANPNVRSNNGWTPLILAILMSNQRQTSHQNHDLSIVKVLLTYGANPNEVNADGWTSLMAAAEVGHHGFIKILLETNAEINVQGDMGETALIIATQNGCLSIVSALLAKKANPNLAIFLDCTYQNVEKSSTKYPSNLGSSKKDDRYTLLRKELLSTKIVGETALHIACHNGYLSIVSTLLINGADPNAVNEDGWTPLMLATEAGHDNIINVLLKADALVDVQGNMGETALHIACINGFKSIVSIFLTIIADPNIVCDNGWTSLMLATEACHSDVVNVLLKANARTDIQGSIGETALHIACQHGKSFIVSALLSNAADPNVATNDGYTPLILAAASGHSEVVQDLLNAGAVINARAKAGETALHVASQSGHLLIMRALLANGADSKVVSNNGTTPLMAATICSDIDFGSVCDILLKAGVLVNAQSNSGETALHIAIQNENSFAVSSLLANGADPDVLTKEGATPLHFACRKGYLPVVSSLLKHHADLTLVTSNGWTPLQIASSRGHDKVVIELIKSNVNVNFQSPIGITALHLASSFGHGSVVTLLLDAEANPHLSDSNGMTPIVYAKQKRHHDIVRIFKKFFSGEQDDARSLASSIGTESSIDGVEENDDIANLGDFQYEELENTKRFFDSRTVAY